MSHTENSLRPSPSASRWYPLAGSRLQLPTLPGWVVQLTHNGERSLLVCTNGRAVFTMPAADA